MMWVVTQRSSQLRAKLSEFARQYVRVVARAVGGSCLVWCEAVC
jgi:hypothetical protein